MSCPFGSAESEIAVTTDDLITNSPPTQAPTGSPGAPASEFRDDELGRLQGILLGDHARRTNDRLETIERALLGAIADLRTSIDERFSGLEARIDAESDTRSRALNNVSGQVSEETRIRERALGLLRTDFDAGYDKTTRLIDDLEQRTFRGLQVVRGEMQEELEASMTSMNDRNVARTDLVRALIQATEEISESRDDA